jgi:hypothetical protein
MLHRKQRNALRLLKKAWIQILPAAISGYRWVLFVVALRLGLITDGIINAGYGPLVAILFAGAGLVIYNVIRKNKARNKK